MLKWLMMHEHPPPDSHTLTAYMVGLGMGHLWQLENLSNAILPRQEGLQCWGQLFAQVTAGRFMTRTRSSLGMEGAKQR